MARRLNETVTRTEMLADREDDMADEQWVDVGRIDDFAIAGPPRHRAKPRDRAVMDQGRHGSAPCPTPATTSAARSARAGSTATTSSAPGTTGSSTAAPAWASRASRRTRVPAYAVKVENGRLLVNLDGRDHAHARRRTRRIRWRASSSARPGRSASSASRRRRWTRRNPRYSGSDALLDAALDHAAAALGAETRLHPAQRAQLPRLRGLLLEERRTPAPGPARSPRWTPATSWTRSTRRWCTGPTSSWWRRRSAGARRARSTSRWSSG